MGFISNFKKTMKRFLPDIPTYSEELHKECPECEGLGLEDAFSNCDKCDGNGFIPKTYAERHELN